MRGRHRPEDGLKKNRITCAPSATIITIKKNSYDVSDVWVTQRIFVYYYYGCEHVLERWDMERACRRQGEQIKKQIKTQKTSLLLAQLSG